MNHVEIHTDWLDFQPQGWLRKRQGPARKKDGASVWRLALYCKRSYQHQMSPDDKGLMLSVYGKFCPQAQGRLPDGRAVTGRYAAQPVLIVLARAFMPRNTPEAVWCEALDRLVAVIEASHPDMQPLVVDKYPKQKV